MPLGTVRIAKPLQVILREIEIGYFQYTWLLELMG